MAAKYTTTPSSTLPQAPFIAGLVAYITALHGQRITEAEAIVYAGQVFDAAAVPFTGNNQLTVSKMVVQLMHGAGWREPVTIANAVTQATRILAAVEAVQA